MNKDRALSENLIKALADYCVTARVGDMEDSVLVNVEEARKLAKAGDLGNAAASIERAARYAFGMLSKEYDAVCDVMGMESAAVGWRSRIFDGHHVHDASGMRPF